MDLITHIINNSASILINIMLALLFIELLNPSVLLNLVSLSY
ncbi:hypothetical protein SBF1_980003 [Candidatus Desulfosporosinus infrequens]|uniref:Uncharacterized protein n=1 Tax=Candidatus Desulfosporosinus infrequens TaxID=2043169 RepID=A0A2U3LYT8_9FIRM|nr:hypothetical protein SBF1_980003 [Candidatus Desulfosporosinus infrequens]